MNVIDKFEGEYRFLSNFWPCRILWDSLEYPSVENVYQARKTSDPHLRWRFAQCGPGDAKRKGRALSLPEDWHEIKMGHMQNLVMQKFQNDERLRSRLLATEPTRLIEGNTWGDIYWGQYHGIGENRLGIILMHVRALLRNSAPLWSE